METTIFESPKINIPANEYIHDLLDWQRDRNKKYREIRNITEWDFITDMCFNPDRKEEILKDMEIVLPPYLRIESKPVFSLTKYIK